MKGLDQTIEIRCRMVPDERESPKATVGVIGKNIHIIKRGKRAQRLAGGEGRGLTIYGSILRGQDRIR